MRTLNASTLESATQYDWDEYDAHSIVWDGCDKNGDYVNEGLYTIEISASLNDDEINANIFEQGTVGGLDFSADGTDVQIKCKDWDSSDDTTSVYYATTVPIGYIQAVR